MSLKFNPFTGTFDWTTPPPTLSINWGDIGGTLSDQTDLQSALDAKYDASNPAGYITGTDVPTYESDPVFVASQAHNITSTDITHLGNLSGVNTGDQDLNGYLTSSTAASTYLKLDTSNGPLTGDLTIQKDAPVLTLNANTDTGARVSLQDGGTEQAYFYSDTTTGEGGFGSDYLNFAFNTNDTLDFRRSGNTAITLNSDGLIYDSAYAVTLGRSLAIASANDVMVGRSLTNVSGVGTGGINIGRSNTDNRGNSVVVGRSNTSSASGGTEGNVLIGIGNSAGNQRSGAIGVSNSAGTSNNSWAIGYGANNSGGNSMAIGQNISNTQSNLIAIGLGTNNRLNIYNDGSVYVNGGNGSILSSATFAVSSKGSSNVVSVFRGASSQSADLTEWQNSSGTIGLSVSSAMNLVFNATNLSTDTTTGTKIGTATTQKLGFFNATPIVQPANTVAIDDVLVNTGLRASGGSANFTLKITNNLPQNLKGYTVASLPTGVTGDIAYVTDATVVTAKGVAPVGGGTSKAVVFYDGSAWVGI